MNHILWLSSGYKNGRMTWICCTWWHEYVAPNDINVAPNDMNMLHPMTLMLQLMTYVAPNDMNMLHPMTWICCTQWHEYVAPDDMNMLHLMTWICCTQWHEYVAVNDHRVIPFYQLLLSLNDFNITIFSFYHGDIGKIEVLRKVARRTSFLWRYLWLHPMTYVVPSDMNMLHPMTWICCT